METIHKILHYPKCTFKNEVINKICWRKCGETKANQAHIFFFCPGLKSFWHSVIMTLINIFNMKVTFNPIYIIIGKSPPELIQERDQYLQGVLRIAAMKHIMRNWLKTVSPSVQRWRLTIKGISEMESITYRVRNKETEYNRLWFKWVRCEAMI